MWRWMPLLLVLALPMQGCIVKETTHTLYLEPDGSLTWMVLEHAIRSDAGTAEERRREEAGYLARFEAEEHAMAEAFLALRPRSLETRMLRDERPYTTLTVARFSDPSVVFQDLLDQSGMVGRAVVEREEGQARLVLTFPLDDEGDVITEGSTEEEDFLSPLLVAFPKWTFRLPEGRFVGSEGFEVTRGCAIPLDPEEAFEIDPGGEIRYVLAWTVEES